MKNYSFQILTPFNAANGHFNKIVNARNSIFLAGPCPRKDYTDDWRFEAFDILEELGFTGMVITPTNENYTKMLSDFSFSSHDALALQTAWEKAAMSVASAIVFWIPRSEKYPARTTNIEFGEWYKQPHIFVGWSDDAVHNEYIEIKLEEQGKKRDATLFDTLRNAVFALQSTQEMWFTSDTHFGQQRTLELSRRPFYDISNMDCTLISNWNKRVTMQDDVVHAGDFIDPDKIGSCLATYLSNLNFKRLLWVLGNYDRPQKEAIEAAIVKSGRDVQLFDDDYHFTTSNGSRYVVVHEPNDFKINADPDEIVLFGHIHGRSFAKRNGFDLGTDYHHYSPISLEQVSWFKNAMKYWDENVMSDRANVN